MTEIKNRGVKDVLMLVCDGPKGLPEAVGAYWDKTIVQTCIVHLLRNSSRYASKRDWPQLAKDLKPIYTAPSAQAAQDAFADFSDKWSSATRRSFGCGPTPSRSSHHSSAST